MKHFYRRKKLFLLGIVLLLYAFVITPLLVFNVQKKQDTRTRASEEATDELANSGVTWATQQSAQSLCSATGEAQVGVTFINTEDNRSMNVTALDQNSGKSVNVGTVGPNETKTGTISTGQPTIGSGNVKFSLAWTDAPNSTDQRTASYNGIACEPLTTPTPVPQQTTCGNAPTDTVLIIDKSGSMGPGNKLVKAKNAAKNFIDVLSKDSNNRIALVSFSTTATTNSTLTNNYTSVKTQVDGLSANGYTCQECGIKAASQVLAAGRPGVKKVVVMLTDGQANFIVGGTKEVDKSIAEPKAMSAVNAEFSARKTAFFTIGLGDAGASGENKFYGADFLKQISVSTGGKYYFPAPDELEEVYQDISLLIGKGLVSGFMFNDANSNAAYDSGEQKLSGRTVKLSSSASTANKTATSDNSGVYTITGICDGNYTLSQDLPTGWAQTLPNGTNGYAIAINNASSFTDKNFGSKLAPTSTPTPTVTKVPTPTFTPTPTPKSRCADGIDNDTNGFIDDKDSTCHTDGNPKNPNSYDPKKDGEHGGNTCADSKDNNNNNLIDGEDPVCHTDKDPKNPKTYDPNLPESEIKTKLSVTVLLDGIGNRGDNTNPTATSLSNKTPEHKSKPATIELYNTSNQLVAKGTGNIAYDSTLGQFTGSVLAGGYLSDGNYYLKVKLDQYLRRQIPPGIQTIKIGQENKMPVVALVAGDITNDNKLNILDYNSLLDCYSDLAAAPNCSNTDKKLASDINDDAKVNQVDYNLFLREIATQPGE